MSRRTGMVRSSDVPHLRDHLRASAVTVVGVGAAALLTMWLFPGGCDLRGDPGVYRWTCLFPGLLIPVSVALALLMPPALLLNRRLGRPLPDNGFAATLVAAAATQAVLIGGYALALGPAYRGPFLQDTLFLPQPFLSGAVAAGVYMTALRWPRRRP